MKFKRFKSLTFLTLLLGAWSGYAQLKPPGNEKNVLKNSSAGIPGLQLEFRKNAKGEFEIVNAPSTGLNYIQPDLANHNFVTNSPGSIPGSLSTGLMFGGLNDWKDLDSSDESVFNNNSDDIEAFDPSTLSCTEVDADSLVKAAQDLNWANCFEGRLSWTRSKASEKDLLKSDQNVCGCLKGFSKVPGVAEIMSKNVSIKRSKNVAQAELNDILNGFLFQTYSFTGDKDVTTKYSNNLYGNKNGEVPTGEKLLYDANPQLVNDKFPYPADQCVSPRVFILTRQLPNRYIKTDLQKPFSEENWNYKLIEKRYSELMSLPVEEREKTAMTEILELKEKLQFLNRNPVIKYSLAVDVAKAEKPEEAKKLKEFVFNQLKTLIPDECADINSKCYQDYKKKMADLVKDPRLIPALRKEARIDHAERVKRKVNSSGSEVRKEPSQRGIISEFMEQYRLPSPDTCEKDTTKGIECLEIFSGYCRTLDKYADDIDSLVNSQKISLVYNNLDDLLKDDFNPDINTNKDFKLVNDALCNTPVKRKLTAIGYPETATFSQFVNIHCKQKSNPGCSRNSIEAYDILKEAWGQKYGTEKVISQVEEGLSQEEKHRLKSIRKGSVGQMALADIQDMKMQTNRNQSDADLASEMPTVRGATVFDRPLTDVMTGMNEKDSDASKATIASLGQSVANNVAAYTDPAPAYDELPVGYASNFTTPMSTATTAEIPKVEEMSEEKRRELLSDWQKEYDDWKKDKGDSLSSSDKSKDSDLRQEIATLKALLDQQKQISEQQYKLLNDAIIAKKEAIAQLPSATHEEKASEKKPGQSFAATARAIQEEATDLSRAPASIKEVKHNTSGALGGAAAVASISKRGSSSSDGSNESVAREQAKLVNMRRFSDGSITIEPGSTGQLQGNAITVPVSDEQYKMLQVNPAGLNLSQIERSIPKEQIAKLEKSGEIIILLQNGSNPPFEVKVAKRDNRLVYSLKDKDGKDQVPVRRVYTREALAHELKARN